jgi:hypothetical protein
MAAGGGGGGAGDDDKAAADDDKTSTKDDTETAEDDDFLTPKNNTSPILRPEPEQPENFSVFLAILFTVVAVVLCCLSGRKMLSKRRKYEQLQQEVTLVV